MCETFALAINQEIERTGKRTTQLTLMLDFEHFSMRQMASKQGIQIHFKCHCKHYTIHNDLHNDFYNIKW
jgi:hypothetical protein